MKVITKDFQSLKGENTFEFPVGVTIIQGKTDSGKTSLFYAIEDCLTNPAGVGDVINWDAKSCEVTIESNGGYVKWIKTPSSSEYVDRNGKSFVKASKLDSRDIDDLGFYFDKKDNVVNIQGEWSVLFPFVASDTEMFKIFEDIFNISSSFAVVDAIKQDEKEKKDRISDITVKINEITKQNNTIESILGEIDTEMVDKYIQNINNKQNSVSNILADYNTLSDNQRYLNIEVPKPLDTTILTDKGSYYNNLLADYNSYQVNMQRMSIALPEVREFDLTTSQIVVDYSDYNTVLGVISNYERQIADCDKQIEELNERIKAIPVCPTCGRPL